MTKRRLCRDSPVSWKKLRAGLQACQSVLNPMSQCDTENRTDSWGGEDIGPTTYNRRKEDKSRGNVPWDEPYERRSNSNHKAFHKSDDGVSEICKRTGGEKKKCDCSCKVE